MVVVLAGGVGGARFLRGLSAILPPEDITVVINVGDDIELHGLKICPDVDSITYWLSGLVHPGQQWGRADERFVVRDELTRFGHEPWFTLGDRDLALHIHRTSLLMGGASLSEASADIARHLGIGLRLLPASDDRVETRIHTSDGRDLHFQEWWVRERARPDVDHVEFRGATQARPAPGVTESISAADVVIVAPSNPVVSVQPIMAIPGVREALTRTTAKIVGISPIIGGHAVRGMAHRLLPAVGCGIDAADIAGWYGSRADGGLLDAWVLDERDRGSIERVQQLGLSSVAVDTMMDDPEVAARLAKTVLDLGRAISIR